MDKTKIHTMVSLAGIEKFVPLAEYQALESKLSSAEDRERVHEATEKAFNLVCDERDALSRKLHDSQFAESGANELVEVLEAKLKEQTLRLDKAEHDGFAGRAYAEGVAEAAMEKWAAAEERAKALESRLGELQTAVQNYLDAGADPSDEIRWALHHALNDPVVEIPATKKMCAVSGCQWGAMDGFDKCGIHAAL